jgi:hypothetical protein
MAIVAACALFAYYVNSKRPDDDPKKKKFHPLAILFAPITFPLLIVLSVSIFILRVVTYGVFTVILIFFMIVLRKPFLLEWLKKTALFIGEGLMGANTLLIRIFLRPWASSESA